MITNQIPVRFCYIFKKDDYEYRVFDESQEKAYNQLSSGQFVFVRKEAIPFRYQNFATELATALSGEWSVKFLSIEETDSNFYLIRADGLTIFASAPSYSCKDKWTFRFIKPKHKNKEINVWESYGPIKSPNIGISFLKFPEQIAKDIERRLFPEAERVYKLYIEKQKVLEATERTHEQAVAKFCEISGAKFEREKHSGTAISAGFFGNSSSRWQVNHDGTVDLNLSGLSMEQSKKVLNALK